MVRRAYRGIVRGTTVVLEDTAKLANGTEVLVTPLAARAGSPAAVLAAMASPPEVQPEAVDELMCLIEAGRRPVRFSDPLSVEPTP